MTPRIIEEIDGVVTAWLPVSAALEHAQSVGASTNKNNAPLEFAAGLRSLLQL
jgi:hypothetical protein